jgi:peptidoglycan hydrolase-like protein with peptidoglycan-binding domain
VRPAVAAGVALLLAACRHPSKVGTPAAPEAARQQRGEPTRAQKGVAPRGGRPRVPSSPKALLAEGEIGKIQDALARRGYLGEQRRPGALDDPTTRAIRKFQKDEGLAETGFPDRLTLQKLGLDPEDAYGKVRERKGEGSAGSKGDGK